MTRMYTETSTIVQRGEQTGTDRYGRPVYGPPQQVHAPCWYRYSTGEEDVRRGEQYTAGYFIQWPANYYALVRACDSVRLDIGEFEIDGPPGFQPDGFAIKGYVQAKLVEATG